MKNVCFHSNRKFWATLAMLLVFTLPALAQKVAVHGTVLDELGDALIGATVMEKGTTNGTQTDLDGNYELRVAPGATLVFSYVGYDSMEEVVGGRTTINVVMKENSTMLSDVVVIGYGSVKKSDATGSVAMVMPDEVDANIATSAQDLLTGASPGVVVTSSGGSPEGGATIRIRGGASLSASNDPLIVLDGVPLSNDGVGGMANPLAMISPDNIESMTILKDASATAIYGSRASNGVIIITTKKGKSGRPQVNFSANVTVAHDRKRLDVLSGSQFVAKVKEIFGENSTAYQALGYNKTNPTGDYTSSDYVQNANTDWQDQVLRTAISHEYNLSVGGTVGFLPYRVSGSYTMNNGILKNSQMQRVTAGFNLTPKFFDGLLSVNANVKGYYVRNKFTDEGCVGAAVVMDPTKPVYTNYKSGNAEFPYFYNGYYVPASGYNYNNQGVDNPLAMATDIDNIANVYRSNGNLQIDYALHFLPDLHLNLNLGYDVSKSTNTKDAPQNSQAAWASNYGDGAGWNYYYYQLRRNTLLDFYANYKKEVEAIESNFDIMAGYSWQRFDMHYRNNSTYLTTPGFYIPSTQNNGLVVNPATTEHVGHAYNDAPWYYNNTGNLVLVSFFGRLNYTFKDTYLLTFTLRDDGTSRFSKDNRWSLFPSVALGWKINNMPFMESVRENMNEFKLRLGWGQTGQQALQDNEYFMYMPNYQQALINSYYPSLYNGLWATTYYAMGYNPDLKWETTTTWNVGVDMGWWNNRLTVALDWYLRNTKDLLSWVDFAPGAATTNQFWQNIGSLRNLGLEATIGGKPVMTDDWTWNTTFNVAWNQNKITKLYNAAQVGAGGGLPGTGGDAMVQAVGHPAYSFYLYEQVYDEFGKPIEGCYVDQNGDGVIGDDDKVIKHSRDPKVTMSWNNTVSFRNWDLGIQMRASIGNYVYNRVLCERTCYDQVFTNSTLHNMLEADNYFTVRDGLSDYFLENAGFVRCDNITLGYTWPDLLGNKLRLRLYGAVQNPFVITRYRGLDPEIFGGVDNNSYPRPVSYTIGLIATF